MGWFGSSNTTIKDKSTTSKKDVKGSSRGATMKKSTSTKNNNPIHTIEQLRNNINQQEKRELHIQSKMNILAQNAKIKINSGDKKGAIFAMKQRKMYENELDKISNVRMTLETQVMNLESAVQNKDTFHTLKQGTNAMQKIRKDMNIDKVDDMMDDIREEMETHQEISNALGQNQDFMPVMDEDELFAELYDLQKEDAKNEASKYPTAPTGRLSSSSNKKQQQQAAKKEREEASMLSELRAMMS